MNLQTRQKIWTWQVRTGLASKRVKKSYYKWQIALQTSAVQKSIDDSQGLKIFIKPHFWQGVRSIGMAPHLEIYTSTGLHILIHFEWRCSSKARATWRFNHVTRGEYLTPAWFILEEDRAFTVAEEKLALVFQELQRDPLALIMDIRAFEDVLSPVLALMQKYCGPPKRKHIPSTEQLALIAKEVKASCQQQSTLLEEEVQLLKACSMGTLHKHWPQKR